MDISFPEFRSVIQNRLLDLLWQQWSALGVPGHTDKEERRVVDPESLLLLSVTVARFDARLFDEILDWLVVNGDFLNVQRLRNLRKRFDFQGLPQLSAISEILAKKSSDPLKWKRLVSPPAVEQPEPLFFFKDGSPLPVPDDVVPEFRTHGLLRGPIAFREHAQPFPARGMPSVLLRLRALIGVNARCELLCLLAAGQEIHASDVARQAGYAPRYVQKMLAEMVRSGAIQVRSGQREKWYSLAGNVLDALLRPDHTPTPWISWAPLFRALEVTLLASISPKLESLDELTQASELRRISKQIRPLLADAGWGSRLEDDSAFHGVEYTSVFKKNISSILAQLSL